MKKDLKEELYSRDYTRAPRRIVYFLYRIFGYFVTLGMKCEYKFIDDPRKENRPVIILQNHLSRVDHIFISRKLYPMKFTFMVAYNEFFRSGQHTFLKLFRCIPKRNSVQDLTAMKLLLKYTKAGNSIIIAPEGFTSVDGQNHPVDVGSGKLLQKLNMPIYFAEIKGQYLLAPKCCTENRKGKCEVTYRKLWEPEEIQAMDSSELEDKLNELFRHDEYEYNKERKGVLKAKSGNTKDLEDLLYRCPKCGKLFTMHSHNNELVCDNCGNGFTMDEYNIIRPYKDSVTFDTPTKWSDYERKEVIKEVLNPNFKYEEKVKIGYLPYDHVIKGGGTSEIGGEGKLIIDHQGLHYIGKLKDKDVTIDLSYNEFHTVLGSTDFSYFFIYKNGEYYDIFPLEHHSSYHIMLLVEELHRIHVNLYKCFKWHEYMYEGLKKA